MRVVTLVTLRVAVRHQQHPQLLPQAALSTAAPLHIPKPKEGVPTRLKGIKPPVPPLRQPKKLRGARLQRVPRPARSAVPLLPVAVPPQPLHQTQV